jgi:hypothetical protein
MLFASLRQLFVFVIAAGAGALLTLAVRSAWHRPYAPTPTVPPSVSIEPVKNAVSEGLAP